MVFPQVGADHQHPLQLRQRRNTGTQPTNRIGRCKFCIAKTVIDVITTQAAHEGCGKIQFFKRTVRAGQRTDTVRTMVGLDLLEAVGNIFECSLPVNRLPLAALLEHWT